jgi:hypothetical protein
VDSRIRFLLRLGAVLLFLGVVCLWFNRGAQMGWTKTTTTVMRYNAATAQLEPQQAKRFRPGLDVLALGLAGSVVLLAVSIRASKP